LQADTGAQGGTLANDVKAWFENGQAALQTGTWIPAEKSFRNVLTADPNSGAAYANLGVIEMRRKNWTRR